MLNTQSLHPHPQNFTSPLEAATSLSAFFPAPVHTHRHHHPSHKPTSSSAQVFTPRSALPPRLHTLNFDVWEGAHEFILEGDFPGVNDKDGILIEWVGDRVLVVEGVMDHTVYASGIETPLSPASSVSSDGASSVSGEEDCGSVSSRRSPRIWMQERGLGVNRRSFSFPCAVNAEEVEAKLDQGSLTLRIPKDEEVDDI